MTRIASRLGTGNKEHVPTRTYAFHLFKYSLAQELIRTLFCRLHLQWIRMWPSNKFFWSHCVCRVLDKFTTSLHQDIRFHVNALGLWGALSNIYLNLPFILELCNTKCNAFVIAMGDCPFFFEAISLKVFLVQDCRTVSIKEVSRTQSCSPVETPKYKLPLYMHFLSPNLTLAQDILIGWDIYNWASCSQMYIYLWYRY